MFSNLFLLASSLLLSTLHALPATPSQLPSLSVSDPPPSITTIPAPLYPATTWALARISHRAYPPSDSPYLYPSSAGQGITIYHLDSGVNPSLSEFNSRVSLGPNFVPTEPAYDMNGHGTYSASLMIGAKYGVARLANLVSVKVLNSNGTGTIQGIVDGLTWVRENATPGASIAYLSFGGGRNADLENAIQSVYTAGIPLITGAGAESTDACQFVPPVVQGVLVAGASDENDSLAGFTNVGKCVRMYAPGVNVAGVWSDGEVKVLSGTSVSGALAAGVAALVLGEAQGQMTPEQVYTQMVNQGTKGVIQGGTGNEVLLYNGGEDENK